MRILKQVLVSSIIFLYLLSTFTQTSIYRFSPNLAHAQSGGSISKMVAVLVDTAVYGAVKGDLGRYANTYIPKQLPGTELVVVPLDPAGFTAADVHRVLENMYFDGKKDEGSALVGVIVFGDVPLPSVEIDGEAYLSMHPFTDFEGPPMFTFDEGRGLRLPNGSAHSQPELRHAIIPGRDTSIFTKFFTKLKKYFANPTEYATGEMWYDDYQMMQKSFSNEQLDEYLNTLIFAEDKSYNRFNTAFTDVLNSEYGDDLVDSIKVMEEKYAAILGAGVSSDLSHPDVDAARGRIQSGVGEIKDHFKDEQARNILENIESSSVATDSQPIPTLINAKQNENNFRDIFSVYGDEYLSHREDNISAGARYGMTTMDSTLEFVQLKDAVAVSYLKDINTILEHAIDRKIQDEQYMLKQALPTWYEHRESEDILACAPDIGSALENKDEFTVGPVNSKYLDKRFENFYFGRYAGDVQQYDDMHVYRGDRENLGGADLLASELAVHAVEDIPVPWNKSTVGSSFGGFTQQTRALRGNNFDLAPLEFELYDQFKCEDEQEVQERARDYWGGSSQLNLDPDKMAANAKDIDFNEERYDRTYMRHPTTNRSIGGPQYDPAAAIVMLEDEFGRPTVSTFSSFGTQSADEGNTFAVQQAGDEGTLPDCIPLQQDDDIDDDGQTNKQDNDIDGDGLINTQDGDIDGDCKPNTNDDDIDGDGDPNGRDSDCNGGGGNCGKDNDDDSDGIPDDQDPDNDNDGTPDTEEPDQDGDGIDDSEDPDDDNDGIEDQDDPDDDNDGIPDDEEADSDGDGIPDDDDPDNNGGEGDGGVPMITADTLHLTAMHDFSEVVKVDGIDRGIFTRLSRQELPVYVAAQRSRMYCEAREEKDDYPGLTPYEEIEFFFVWENELVEEKTKKVISVSQNPYENGGGVDRFRGSDVANAEIDDMGLWKELRRPWYRDENIPSGKEGLPDLDLDLIADIDDKDLDGDSIENEDDVDIDGDGTDNVDDTDIDQDGFLNWLDNDIDGDMIDNEFDGDADADGKINDDWNNEFSEDDENDEQEEDDDSNGSKCGGGGSCGGGSKQGDSQEPENPIGGDDETPLPELDSPFDYEVENLGGNLETLAEHFSQEYLVIELSDSNCGWCKDQAAKINQDLAVQDQLTHQCDFLTLTPSDDLKERSQSIGAQSSFVGGKSRAITDGVLRHMELLFEEGQTASGIPHTFIVNKEGEVVSRAMGSLPADLDDWCPNSDEYQSESSGIFGLFSQEVYAQEEEEECVPLLQDDDIDDDGKENKQDDDIDGDGLLNTQDSDIDGDCRPNSNDDDIDGDGEPNGRDSDCNGGGGNCGKDNDDDGDGIPDDQDPDNDNDGTPDNEEPDQDGDGIDDSEDPDDDNDGIEDQDDPDDDNDGIPDDEEPDSDGDGTPDDDDSDDDNDGVPDDEEEDEDDEEPADKNDTSTFVPGAPYNTDVRENQCGALAGGAGTYHDWEYRDYHIIDTVVQHKATTNHMLHQSNVLTMGRPIDDPRYTTFHGLGGDLVKFIYADLYNIEVYDGGGKLMEEEQIEQKVREYLLLKVEQYNKQLEDQLEKAPDHYAKHVSAYDFLATVHSSATPNRIYDLLPPRFFLDLVGEEQVKRIAHSLYYLSYPWEERPKGATVAEYIKNARKDFDLDRKLEYVAEIYLLLKPDLPEFEADDPIILPRYIDPKENRKERKAYELGFINSDGKDGMPVSDETYTTYTLENAAPGEFVPPAAGSNDVGDQNSYRGESQSEADQDDAACNVSDKGTVPLLKWPQAFKCWLQKTGEKPIGFELEVEVELQDSFIERMLQDRLSSSQASLSPGLTLDNEILAYQNNSHPSWIPSVFAQEISVLEQVEFGGYVRLEPSNTFVSGSDLKNRILVGSDRDLGDVDVTLRSSGANAIFVNGKNITEQDLELQINLDGTRNELPIQVTGESAVPQDIQVQMCISGECVEKVVTTYVSAGSLDQVNIISPATQIAANGSIPFTLQGTDSAGNPLPFAPSGTSLVIQGGSFDQQTLLNSKQITNLTNEVHFVYAEPDASQVIIRIEKDGQVIGSRTLPVIDIRPVVPPSLEYTLPQKSVGFKSIEGKYSEDRLPKIRLEFQGADENFILPIKISGAEGLVRYGSLNADGGFDQISETVVQGNETFISLLPTGKAGSDELSLTLPGFETKTIPVTIQPSGPDELIFDIPADGADAGDVIEAKVEIFDSRGNPYTDNIRVDLEATGGREIGMDAIYASGGAGLFTGVVKPGGGSCGASGSCGGGGGSSSGGDGSGGDGSGDGSGDGDGNGDGDGESDGDDSDDNDEDSEEDQNGNDAGGGVTQGSATFQANKILWPDEREPQELNVMYLNLYGADRGNEQRILNMLRNEKTLAITTTRKLPGKSIYAGKKTTFAIDGTRNDEIDLIKNMVLEGEHVRVHLGYDGGVGRYYLGTTEDLGLAVVGKKKIGDEESSDPEVKIKTISSSCSQSKNQLLINKDLIGVDFEFGFIHEEVDILPAGRTGKTWNVFYQNELIASFELQPKESASLDIYLEDELVNVTDRSSSSITVEYTDVGAVDGGVPVYKGLSDAKNPNHNLGFRDNFNGITNFSQGQAVGPANQRYADPFLVNFGDPFLKRIEPSPMVDQTDYDGGIGQMVYSSNESMLKVETMDVDADGKVDIVIGYNDGSIRVLKNDGGGNPYTNIGALTVISDGLKDFWPGDIDGDGDEDIMVLTNAEKLRAYKNDGGVLEVDGRPVCIDIPNGEYSSVSQTNQIVVTDVDGSGTLDIVTYAVDGEIEVFYGGGNSYISTDPYDCDAGAIGRNNKNLLKSMKLTAGSSFSDNSLIHRSGLEIPEEAPEPPQGYEELIKPLNPTEEFFSTEEEADQYTEQIKKDKIKHVQDLDKDGLIEDGKKKILDYISPAPVLLRPHNEKGNEKYAYMRAQDTLESDLAESKVTKSLTDKNGGYVEKGDILTVNVSVSGGGGIDYLEKLDIPVVIYKDEFNRITSFNNGLGGTVDRNIGQGYEFMIQGGSSGSFSYDVMYNGNGHARIEVETDLKDMFEEGTSRTSRFGRPVYAGGSKKIRVYPDDACYKGYREYSPGEKFVDLQEKYDEKRDIFIEYFDTQRRNTEDETTDSELDRVRELMGIHEVSYSELMSRGIENVVNDLGTDISVNVDLGTDYVDQFADVMQSVNDAMCKGIKFGETNCGGMPFPFNMSFLSPGESSVFGCKLFDDPGMPILAIPTTLYTPVGPIPFMWPPMPLGAGGYFDYVDVPGKEPGFTVQKTTAHPYNSLFRMYVSPTLTNGVGIAMCGGPYDPQTVKAPFNDMVGNCLVMAAPIPGSCDDGGDAYETGTDEERHERTATVDDLTHDLQRVGTCDPTAQARSPFISSATGNPVAVEGRSNTVIGSAFGSTSNYKSRGGGGTTQDLLQLEQEYTLKGGTSFDLEIQGGDVKGVTQCIMRNRFDKQIRYVANNMLNMQVTLILPDFESVGEGFAEIGQMSKDFDLLKSWKKVETTSEDAESIGSQQVYQDPETTTEKLFMPRSVLDSLEDRFTNPFEQVANLFENTPFINVRQRRVRMQIPRLFEEDISRLDLQMQTWISRNQDIIDAWEASDIQGKDNIVAQYKQAMGDVKRNQRTLDEYKKLPSVLYDYIHARDKYVLEVLDFSEDIVRQLSGWLQVNANRYSKYVDAIILMIGVIETRQPVIDFSTNWKTKCGKCSVDNYDYYSCKLSLFCVDLPILPIPPFNIPDIYIDLSQIRLGIDILLPKFVFLPEKIYFPALPDLPDPRNFELELDIEIPDIPQLPLPPPLPQLPDIKLEADIDLPNLPPAPQIPDLVPSVKMVVDIADFIGTVFCVFKGGIGLVEEQGVKTRIEQLTQRTRSVSPFDTISITLPDSPLDGYNYHIDAFVDLKIGFDELYDVFEGIAEKVNEGVAKGVDELTDATVSAERFLLDQGGASDFLDGAELELELDLRDLSYLPSPSAHQRFTWPQLDKKTIAYHERYHAGGSVQETKSKLKEQYAYMLSRQDFELHHEQLQQLDVWIDNDAQIRPNYASIDAAHKEFEGYVDSVQGGIQDLKSMIIDDYDGFLRTYVPEEILLNAEDDDILVKQFDINVFEGDDVVVDRIVNQKHPLSSYIDLHLPLIEGYKQALDRNSADELNMTDLVYESSNTYIDGLIDRYIGNEEGMILAQNTLPDQLAEGDVFQIQQAEEECIPLEQDEDIDNDGILNQQDIVDIDGDGLENTIDGDIDGDCIPNTKDPDIDGDGVSNGSDSDCNGNGTGCGKDNDDDSDGIPDDQDPDNDNDGTPDDQEGDNDNDGIDDSEDEDDDNDGIPDQEDDTPNGEEEEPDNGEQLGGGAGGGSMPNFAEKEGFEQVDFSAYVEGFFVPGKDKKYHNVMGRQEKVDEIQAAGSFTFVDVNGAGGVDIMSWDSNNIYVKFAGQNDSYGGGGGGITTVGPFSSAAAIEAAAMPDGYVNGIKVRDYERVKYDFAREGNNFESIGFSRQNNEEDAYLVRLSRDITLQPGKAGKAGPGGSKEYVYLLMTPEGVEVEGFDLEVVNELSKKKISQHVDDGTIVQITSYDGRTELVSSILQNLEPAGWRYAKVASMTLDKAGGWTYIKTSPWSRQIVAGNQKRGDDAKPYIELELIRNKTGEIIPGSSEIGGHILTEYTLSGTWLDNGEVLENWIEYEGEIIYFDESDKLRLENLYYKNPTIENFLMGAVDQAGNKTTMEVELKITAPELEIIDVKDKGSGYDVLTEMSATIDDGKIAFLRDRYGRWEEMNPFTFPVKPTDPLVTGGIFIEKDEIHMNGSSGASGGSCNAKTGKISLADGSTPGSGSGGGTGEGGGAGQVMDVMVDFVDQVPEVVMFDTENDQTLFRIGFISQELISLGVLDGSYEVRDIKDGTVGLSYIGGSCIGPIGGECHMYISPEGNLIIPEPHNSEYTAEYGFDEENQAVIYTIQNALGKPVVELRFIIVPLS